MPTIRSTAWILSLLISPALAIPGPSSGDDASTGRGLVNAVGFEIELDSLPSPHPRPVADAASSGDLPRLHVKVGIPWGQVEKTAGVYDWSVADEIVLSHAQAGYAITLHPRGENPLYAPSSSTQTPTVDAWSAFLRALAARYKDQADTYGLDAGSTDVPAAQAAYLLKLSAVMIRSSDQSARVVLWGLDARNAGVATWLESLYGEEMAAYLDGVAVAGVLGAADTQLPAIRAQMQLHDPGAMLWLSDNPVPGAGASAGRLLRGYLQGVDLEAALTLFRLDYGPEGSPWLLPQVERIRSVFLPSFTPLVESGRGIQVTDSLGQPQPVRTVRLLDPDAKKVLIAYDAGEGAARGTQAVMSIDTLDVADPRLVDVAAGESAPVGAYQKDESAGLTRAAVPLAEYPLVLEYRRFTSPLYGEGEKLQVTEKRLPSVDEIIARHQAVQTAQVNLLRNVRADARVDYHFRVGAGSTIDVTVMNKFFFDPNVGAEFEQTEFYVSGVKWRADRMPEFPLPQPEKVMSLPLDISLDKRYSYRLAGEEKIDEYDCWVVEFDPLVPGGSLYKGRVWIDKVGFARVQIASLQTGLEPPILSNDETDSYRPVRGPDGLDYWLLSRIDGQQVFSMVGRNLVLAREVTFTGHVINDAGFVESRRQAYASDHQILRETPGGQRYLERTPDGGRVVKDELDPDNLFLLGGVFYNKALDFPIPLAGVNYFNRDIAGSGAQTNVFFGGVLLFANLTDPSLFDTSLDGSVEVSGQGFSSTDTPVVDGREREEENVDLTEQSLTVGLGLPFADYWKMKITGDLSFQGFAHDEDTASGFEIPRDHILTTLGLRGEFNRNTWTVAAGIEGARRSRWECWGEDCDTATPEQLEEFDEARHYMRYDGVIAKDFFLPLGQKIHASVAGFGGDDLDRFSQYRFDFFGNRLKGFGGAGYSYSNGAKAQVQYAFNLGQLLRFDASIDHARVRNRDDVDNGYNSFTGVGLSGQTIVGPNLIITLDWGLALRSDVGDYRGDQELLLTLLRLFQ